MRQRAGIILRVRLDVGESDVTGGADEFSKFAIRHRRTVDPERIDRDAMNGGFFGIVPFGAHAERAARNPDHVTRRLRRLRRDRSRRCNVAFTHRSAVHLEAMTKSLNVIDPQE